MLALVLAAATLAGCTQSDDAPWIGIAYQNNNGSVSAVVTGASAGLVWEDLDVEGCSGHPSGPVEKNDELTGCGARIVITHAPTGEELYRV